MAKAITTRSFYCQVTKKHYRNDGMEYEADEDRVRELVRRGYLRDPVYGDNEELPETEAETRQTTDRDLSDVDYRELQQMAKHHGIKANQSADDLREAIREAREE